MKRPRQHSFGALSTRTDLTPIDRGYVGSVRVRIAAIGRTTGTNQKLDPLSKAPAKLIFRGDSPHAGSLQFNLLFPEIIDALFWVKYGSQPRDFVTEQVRIPY
jgi:hypothetical protein